MYIRLYIILQSRISNSHFGFILQDIINASLAFSLLFLSSIPLPIYLSLLFVTHTEHTYTHAYIVVSHRFLHLVLLRIASSHRANVLFLLLLLLLFADFEFGK